LVGRYEEMRPLGRHRRRWEDNVRLDLREKGWEFVAGCIWFRIRTSGGLL